MPKHSETADGVAGAPRAAVSPDELAADRERALALTPVSRETLARLDKFVAVLLERQARINLIAASTLPELWTRHIADSLQLLPLAPEARVWADFGSGAGFPGLVLACALAETAGAEVHLVESTGKKASFLRDAVAVTGAPAIVHNVRIEEFVRNGGVMPDVVTARALAPLSRLLGYAEPLVKTGAKALFLKGQDVEAELTESSKYWTIQASLVPSKTSENSRIVVVREAAKRKR
jgi:16S rRNA (guanine527-N7)-methyltransferase